MEFGFKHKLTLISPTFYTITLIIYDDWIRAPTKLKMLLKRTSGAAINTLCNSEFQSTALLLKHNYFLYEIFF